MTPLAGNAEPWAPIVVVLDCQAGGFTDSSDTQDKSAVPMDVAAPAFSLPGAGIFAVGGCGKVHAEGEAVP
jgi:hypothetical protein